MTFTFKLSRRLAVTRVPAMMCFLVLAACASGDPVAPTDPGNTTTPDPLVSVLVLPKTATIETNQQLHFRAKGLSATGDSLAVSIEWTATGGTISVDGVFAAGSVGSYRIVGRGKGKHAQPVDSSTVTVVAPQPTLKSIVVSPASATVPATTSVGFTASGRLSDNSTVPVGVNWTATGGTIDPAGNFTAGATQGSYHVIATNTSGALADTVPITVGAAPAPTLSRIVLLPVSATLTPGATQVFKAYGKLSNGDSVAATVTYGATGGAISGSGNYTAGGTTGTFRVIATSTTGNFADTSAVTIQAAAPTITQIVLTPSSSTVMVGGTVQFKAYGRNSVGDSVAAAVTYTATGGTVTTGGNYTAGGTPGAFRVIATRSGGPQADTSSVTITAAPPATHSGFYVAPTGSSSGDGSSSRPWDLASVLSGGKPVQAGDTVWLRGGTYSGNFHSLLTGGTSAPIIVRQYPGERATISGTLAVDGSDTWYWGFEVANTNTSTQDVIGVDSHGPRTRFINLVIHDHSGDGMGVWSEAPDAEVYGTIVYNNGFRGSSSGSYGHGIYSQNATGAKRLADNIIFQSFGYGYHIYTEGSFLRNFTLDGNVCFNNGMQTGFNILVGGSTPVENLTVTRNMTYESPGFGAAGTWIGRSSAQNVDMSVTNNYLVGGGPVFRLYNWTSATVQNNTLIGAGTSGSMIDQEGSAAGYTWGGNTYYGNSSASEWVWGSSSLTFSGWRQATGLGGTDTYAGTRPTGVKVFVRPNQYEPGRANVIVYNWDRVGSVAVDLSAVLTPGDQYEIRNVQAYWGTPATSGTYGGGSVSVPLSAVSAPTPIVGWPGSTPSTGTDFLVFVVLRKGS